MTRSATIRSLVLAAVIAALLVAGAADAFEAAGPSKTHRDAVSRADAVPWSQAPPPQTQPPKPIVNSSPDNARACSPSDLNITSEGVSALAGSLDYAAQLTNVSRSVCSLRAAPTSFAEITPAGARVPLPFTNPLAGGNLRPLVPSNLVPGASGSIEMNSFHECDSITSGGGEKAEHAHDATRLVIGLSTGGNLTLGPPTEGGFYQFPCPPVTVSSLGVNAPTPTYPPSPYAGLTAAMQLPKAVRAGTTLTYIVALTNTTDRQVALTPCPGYTEALTHTIRADVERSYALNCKKVGNIDPHATVRFQMRLPIPANTANGLHDFFWSSVVVPLPILDPDNTVPTGAVPLNGTILVKGVSR